MNTYYFYEDGFATEVSREVLLDFRDYISMKYEIVQWKDKEVNVLHLSFKLTDSLMIEFGLISETEF